MEYKNKDYWKEKFEKVPVAELNPHRSSTVFYIFLAIKWWLVALNIG